MSASLFLSGVAASFGARPLFSGLDLTLASADVTALVGPNGAGKTTLFRMVTGQDLPDEGQVAVDRGVTIGYFMGANWTVIEPYTDIFSKVVYVLIILIVLWFAVKLVLREKKRREMGLPDPDQEYIEELEDEKAHDEKADGDL